MIDKDQLRDLITRVLRDLEDHTSGKIAYSKEAGELLMMTAAHESRLGTYIKQVKGPALGIFQMEPETFYDIMDNYVGYREWLESAIIKMCPDAPDTVESHEELEWNLKLMIVMARIHYYRVPHKLPRTPREMASYAKQFYNTYEGKALIQDYLDAYLDNC